uniref:Uncharacterized protein n=1 Tax=Amphimedon queenslandica TaxID=400682 RepID=A0A1X7TZW2_AMPQE
MNFNQRRGTTNASVTVEEFREIQSSSLLDIIAIVEMEKIAIELIFNWDQTGFNLVPVSTWTMAVKGSKCVEIRGLSGAEIHQSIDAGNLILDDLEFENHSEDGCDEETNISIEEGQSNDEGCDDD